MSDMRVFTARKVITLNPAFEFATAVAVQGRRIVEVGTMETLAPWLEANPHTIDERFAEQVILPGLIDPHLHPSMAAVLLPMHFVTAMEWRLPWAASTPVTTHADFLGRLTELDAAMTDPSEPLLVWGYHQLWHGQVRRAELNAINISRPILSWHRSFHEIYLNDGALDWLELSAEDVGNGEQIDFANGHFYESGKAVVMSKLNPYLLAPERFREGLRRLRQVVHAGGHTTIGDMATGIFNLETEWEAMCEVLDNAETPFRVECVARGAPLGSLRHDPAELRQRVDGLPELNTHRLRFGKRVKLFCDGAFFSQLAQMKPPGYIGGREGEWMMAPEALEAMASEYWHAGYRVHIHTTGDLGLDLVLDILERLQWQRPRFDHGFTIEHFGFSNPEQVERIARLGASVSCNVYYMYELSDMYSKQGIGYERASHMARVGACVKAGITTALHSDFTMAPARPLGSAWVAANRINCEGNVMAPDERLSVAEALRAVTIEAARILGIEDEVGSLRAGKKADMTVVDADPFEVGPEGLNDLTVLATVFEGEVYEVAS
ncbi:MAG: amidohydrolase [Chromatiales bacterium]|jgi:predicted amidohydrolase YtcJ|nr:amidohydrolase [Chromatiales bacterium]